MKKYLVALLFMTLVCTGAGCTTTTKKTSKKDKQPKIIHTVFKDISEPGAPKPTADDEAQTDEEKEPTKDGEASSDEEVTVGSDRSGESDTDNTAEDTSENNSDENEGTLVSKSRYVPIAPDPSILSAVKKQKEVDVLLLPRNSTKNWSLDTNHTGKGSLDDGAIKFVYAIDKKRAKSSTLRYKSPQVIDFSDKKLLKFDFKWSEPHNQLYINLSNKAGKSLTRHLVGKDVTANEWHTVVVPLIGLNLQDIDKIDFENQGDMYEGWSDGDTPTLWIDNVSYIKPPEKNLFGKKIVLQFDDGYEDNYTAALPIFKKYGYVATLGMITNVIGGKLAGVPMLSAKELLEMQAAGWEIASHTATHKSMEDATSESSMDYQMSESLKTLKGLGLNVKHLIYPFTKSSAKSRRVSLQYYQSASIGTPPNQNLTNGLETIYGKPDRYLLNRTTIGGSTTLDNIKLWVNDSYQYQTMLILYFHDINDGGGKDAWSAENLDAMLSWLKDEGYQTLQTTEALSYYGL